MRTGSHIGGALRLLAGACALAALGVLVAWAVGRVAGDRTLATQYLAWAPTPVVLAVGGVIGALSWLLAATAGRARRRDGRIIRRVALALWVAAAADLVVNDLGRSGPGRPGVLRVAVWNVASFAAEDWSRRLAAAGADVAVAVNPPSYAALEDVAASIGPGAETLIDGRFSLVSRFAVLRWGLLNLGLDSREDPEPLLGRRLGPDPGFILYAELDTTDRLGRTAHVWVVDLPSDIRLPRRTVAERLAAAPGAWTGPMFVRAGPGRWERSAEAQEGLPSPDLVVGDFNIPRGAWSLRRAAGAWTHAFDQAGRGWGGTFPREVPVWHIDHAFVGPRLRATRYEIVDPGSSRHRMQVVEVEPAERGGGSDG